MSQLISLRPVKDYKLFHTSDDNNNSKSSSSFLCASHYSKYLTGIHSSNPLVKFKASILEKCSIDFYVVKRLQEEKFKYAVASVKYITNLLSI